MTKVKYVDFELDGHFIEGQGEYDEETDTMLNIDYQCNLEVDDEMDDIIIDHCNQLLREKFDHDELEF